ncbi:MAG: branched-chain amino acid transport system II carrier protein [Synergistaceae bacterium]|nr:branched-chain amino acid transport system II carrier protein [Synergistaceae bacterium]
MNTGKSFITYTIITGFALFSAFFGAGNLIFPPAIGLLAGSEWRPALFGFFLSGVLLPVLAFTAAVRAREKEDGIASDMGKTFSLLFTSVIMLCTAMITVPRTAATAHELSVVAIVGPSPEILTSCVYFIAVAYFSINPSTVMEKLGKYLTPVLLIVMAVIIVKGVLRPLGVPANTGVSGAFVFHDGFINGYQTMDVFGGLVVAGAIIATISELQPDDRRAQAAVAYSCGALAGLGLLLVYGGLIYIGATGSGIFEAHMDNVDLLVVLVEGLYQDYGALALACVAFFACLTTAIGLGAGASYFFSRATQGKLSYRNCVIAVCVVSVLISAMGVDTIIHYTEPILIFIYPSAIVLVLLNVFRCRWMNRGTFIGATYCTLVVGFVDMLAVPGETEGIAAYMMSVIEVLPFSALGLAWVVPAVVGGILGTLRYGFGKEIENI